MSENSFTIEIPADNDGFALLQCEYCGELFKVKPCDYYDDGILEIRCPSCGLISDNYLTEEAIELATKIAKNYALELIHSELKKTERQFSKGFVKFKAGKPPKREDESPLTATIEALTITKFPCCSYEAKIKPILRMCGCNCPFCGVVNYEFE
jgi:hypothetical protein